MNADKLTITILDDGSIKIETDKVSIVNHTGAEGFIRDMATMMGSLPEVKKKLGVQHVHGHDHVHQ